MSPSCRLLAWGVVLLSVLLAACRSAPPVEAPPVPRATRQYAGSTLTFFGLPGSLGPALEATLLRRFEQDTGIRVTLVPMPAQTDEAFRFVQRVMAERRGDVFMLDVVWSGTFADRLLDVSSVRAGQGRVDFPILLANSTVEGRLVSLPTVADVGLLYSRADLLSRYGYSAPPRTWEELEAMARVIQDGERKRDPSFTGFVWQGSPYEGLTCNALEWQMSHGAGSFVSGRTGQANVSSPRAIAAFRRAQGWVGTISPSSVTTYQELESLSLFREGKAAFMRNWLSAFVLTTSGETSILGHVILSPLPHAQGFRGSGGALGGWGVGVSRFSANPEAAKAFAAYLTCPEVQAWRAIHAGHAPSLPALYQDASILAAQPFLRNVEPLIRSAVARPDIAVRPRYPDVSSVYFRGVSAMLRDSDPDFVARFMQREMNEVLGGGQASGRR